MIRKRKVNLIKPKGKPKANGPWIRTVRGVKYQWIPNPSIKESGYWRKMPDYLQ